MQAAAEPLADRLTAFPECTWSKATPSMYTKGFTIVSGRGPSEVKDELAVADIPSQLVNVSSST